MVQLLTLGGIPFCNLSIEEAVQFLPPDEQKRGIETNSYSSDETYKTYAAWKLYTSSEPISPISDSYGFKKFWADPMSVGQRSDESTLLSIGYSCVRDLHGDRQVVEDIKSETREIATGDSLESLLQKMGISTEGSAIIASIILQFGKDSLISFDLETGVLRIRPSPIEVVYPPIQVNFSYASNNMYIHASFDSFGRMEGFSVRVGGYT